MNDEAARQLETQKAYYDLRAPDYMDLARPSDRPGRGLLRDDEAAVLVDELLPAGDVLELACGPGAFTRHLVRHAASVTAVDASPRMLERNEREIADSRVRYVEADILRWFPDRTYDVVFFANWLSHVPDSVVPSFFSIVRAALGPGAAWHSSMRTTATRRSTTPSPSATYPPPGERWPTAVSTTS